MAVISGDASTGLFFPALALSEEAHISWKCHWSAVFNASKKCASCLQAKDNWARRITGPAVTVAAPAATPREFARAVDLLVS